MLRTPDIFGSSIVALGAFNPAIFSPDWLEKNRLIGADDASAAKALSSYIISGQVSFFETGWFSTQVVENQFVLNSKGPLSPAFRDLAMGILSLVPHTPISAVGLNFMGHYRMGNDADYHKVGDVLAPKSIWKDLYSGENDSIGVGDLTMRIQRGPRGQPTTKDERRISLQSSTKLPCALYLAYNDHHEIVEDRDRNLTSAERAIEVINNDWESSQADALRVFDGLISRALEELS